MTDLTKLSLHDLLPHPVRASVAEEIQNRFAALTVRITELEQELQEARERVEWLDNACRGHDLKAEAAALALDEAYESCRLMEDRVNRLVDQSARVVVLENALREYARHLPPCALWITMGDAGPNGEQHPCTCGLAAALAVRAEETT